MAQKTLNAFVVIGGHVDNTFNRIGTELVNLGSTVDEISEKLINFGKESLDVYKSYDFNMAELETVWGKSEKFANNSRALQATMKAIRQDTAEWAANRIFHTNDISNALVQAAHTGWDYEQMLEGIPAAMDMAQAAGVDLSTALNYIVTAQRSFGWSFDEIPDKLDKWIYAANKSAGTARDFGETFLKLGSTVRLASDTEELLAMTKVMHDMGTTGSAAGTLIRTSLLKLYAPSGKASKVLEQLGATKDEIAEIRDDDALVAALKTLSDYGFSVFDPITKQAKPALQVYSELGQALVAVSGYTQEADESMQQFYDRVLHHETVMGIMSEVFGIRGIQGSMNMLLSLDEAMQMYNDLTDNAAAGTTEYVRERMNNTLYGSTELFLSKVEELHRKTGEELAGDWQKIQGFVGGIVDDLNAMDSTEFSAVVAGLKVMAVAGPGLILAGSALRFIGMLMTPAGAIGMGAVALASIAASIQAIQDADFRGKFGNMDLDMSTLNEYITTLGEDFNTAFERVSNFANALDTATKNYETASATFSSDLLSAILTKKELTPAEKEAFEQLGIDIYEQVLASINASSDMATEFWNTIYGGDEVAAADPKFRGILELLTKGNEKAIAQAEDVAARLKKAMLKGFEEGFTPEDYDTILKLFEEYNALVAEAQAEAYSDSQLIEQEKWLHKAQTASLEQMRDLSKQVSDQRDAQLAEYDEYYETARAATMVAALKTGMTREEAEAYLAESDVEKKAAEYRAKSSAAYDEFLLTLWESQARQSDLSADYALLSQYTDLYMLGGATADKILSLLTSELGGSVFSGSGMSNNNARAQLGKVMGYAISYMGGEEAVAQKAQYYEQTGNTEMAARMKHFLAMEQLVNGFYAVASIERPDWDFLHLGSDFKTTAMDAQDPGAKTIANWGADANREMVEALMWGSSAAEIKQARQQIDALTEQLESNRDRLANAQAELEHDTSQLDRYSRGGNTSATALYRDYVAADKDKVAKIEAEIQATEAAIEEWQAILDDHLAQSVSFPDAEANAQAARQAIEGQFSTPIEQSVLVTTDGASGGNGEGLDMMAGGGRRTSPAIFAEAGIPEWYIPEEHTDNTARLILGAAYGSGFDIFDLAEMMGARMYAEGGYSGPTLTWPTLSTGGSSGGGSGGESSSGIQVQYSPVIHADNAAGVERALKEDKKRFEKWINEWWERKKLYESLVMYE